MNNWAQYQNLAFRRWPSNFFKFSCYCFFENRLDYSKVYFWTFPNFLAFCLHWALP